MGNIVRRSRSFYSNSPRSTGSRSPRSPSSPSSPLSNSSSIPNLKLPPSLVIGSLESSNYFENNSSEEWSSEKKITSPRSPTNSNITHHHHHQNQNYHSSTLVTKLGVSSNHGTFMITVSDPRYAGSQYGTRQRRHGVHQRVSARVPRIQVNLSYCDHLYRLRQPYTHRVFRTRKLLRRTLRSRRKETDDLEDELVNGAVGGGIGGIGGIGGVASRPLLNLKEQVQLLTVAEFPANVRVRLAGTVASFSVKYLGKLHAKISDRETRDAWWDDLRREIRGHAKALRCSSVLGYRETCTIVSDCCILTAMGTAAMVRRPKRTNKSKRRSGK